MAHYRIAVIAGDGIGPEVVAIGVVCMQALASRHGFEVELTDFPHGASHYTATDEVLSDASLQALKAYDAIYLGAVGAPEVKPGIIERGLLLKLRFELDQYINLRPVKLYPGVECPLSGKGPEDLDYIVVRENTGGLYSGIGGIAMRGTTSEVATQTMLYTYEQVERCLRYAFELAATRPAKRLALIGKTNVLTYVFDLWDRVFNEMGDKDFPEVAREYYHVDAACMHMINEPERFDVMVTSNMFGDIITDIGAMTQGGLGMACSGNLRPDRAVPSMFEPVHGTAPDIAGQGLANPIAAIMTVKLMLDFLGEGKAAMDLDDAISNACASGLKGQGTREIGDRVLAQLT